ncbi:SH3 domain-containing protein [Amaricoccus solimangrovi]|uniref:Aspartyl-trna synthetase n=1 Tax=Amaricoccus solimangrovi TaxID=2589815 RepID=A0A501WQ11_9RHOB|nr:SH3 domain-containing protein [Amaricoccus solimangrovi]TPE50194.1 aspartyl-trna synthetase [Amaricoccus solimangrovi]
MAEPYRWAARAVAGLAALASLAAAAPAEEAAAPAAAPQAVASGVGPVTHLPLPRFVSMRGETANARRGPSLDQRVDWEFRHRGMPLEVTAEYGNWRRVRDVDGKGGWVHHALLSGTRTALVIGADRVALRDRPEEAARIVALADPGAIGRIDACAGAWCEISAAGSEGWLPRAAIWGVSPDETID